MGFDLLLAVTDWVPELAWRERIVDLTQMLRDNPPDDWPLGWSPAMHQLCTFSEHSWAMPYHDGPQALHYRHDLFAHAGIQPPSTWSEFLEVAKQLTSKETWGCCIGGYPDGHNNVYDFAMHLQSRSGKLLNERFEAQFNCTDGVEALTFLHDLIHVHGVCDPECLHLNSVQSGDYYASGRAAMMWNWVGFAATAEAEQSSIQGLNEVTTIPGGVALNVFWAFVLLRDSHDPDLAYEFLRHLATAKMDLLTSYHGGIGTRLSTWNDPTLSQDLPFYRILEPTHERTVTLPTFGKLPVLVEILNQAIDDALNQRRSPSEALAAAAEAWGNS